MKRIGLLLLLTTAVAADVVVVKGAGKVVGRVTEDGDEVIVNPYNSTHPKMVFGVRRFQKSQVKSIRRTLPEPAHEFQRRMAKAADAEACFAVAEWCLSQKLKNERVWALQVALRFDPQHAAARKALGGKAPRGNWGEQVARAEELLAAPAAERAPTLTLVRADRHFPFDERYLQRALRSKGQPRGHQRDRPVAMRADKLDTGARYTLFVPESYDPLRPTPLVIGLHGGGRGGADGKLVVGSGASAMNFYQRRCNERGWICVCPTALEAGWGGPRNDALIDAILDELAALYNIDENRIYLVGHSMGGGGTWVQGARQPEVYAAIAPAASYGVRGIDALGKTRTGFYVYHSEDDPRTRIGGVRPQMKNLPGSGLDFVYTELQDRGHAFPPEVINDIFEFFAMRRLARGRGRFKPTVRPQSSFDRKLSRDEKKYLPALPALGASGGGGAEVSRSVLLKQLKTGGGVAAGAVPQLVALKDDKLDRSVARILIQSRSEADVRLYCARVLGQRKATAEIDALGRVLLMEPDAKALLAVLDALALIGNAECGDSLLRFIEKRQSYLLQRASDDQLDHSDWITITPPLARACELVGTFKPKRGASVIARRVLEGVLLSKLAVVYDRQNQNPLPAGQALARSACGALARIGDPMGLYALRLMDKAAGSAGGVPIRNLRGPVSIVSGWPQDPRIAGEARAAIQALSK